MEKLLFALLICPQITMCMLEDFLDRTTNFYRNDQSSILHEFQLSLRPERTDVVVSTMKGMGLLQEIPAFGIYKDPYLFGSRLALIELTPDMVVRIMPQAVKNAFIAHFAPKKSIYDSLQGKTLYPFITITMPNQIAPAYNVVFHPFLRKVTAAEYPNANLLMGIFDADGVQATAKDSMPFNQLKPINVNIHNGGTLHFSPNNAKFSMMPGRAFATFWTVAISPDAQSIAITYHLRSATNNNEKLIDFIQPARTLKQLLENLQTFAETSGLAGADKQAVDNFISTINAALGTTSTADLIPLLLHDIRLLQAQVINLNASLAHLESAHH